MAARKNDRQFELDLCRLEIIECKHCHLPLPATMFGRCVVRGKEYRRGWCKFCEAWRERRRFEARKGHDEMANVRTYGWDAWDAHTRRVAARKASEQ